MHLALRRLFHFSFPTKLDQQKLTEMKQFHSEIFNETRAVH